MKTVLLKMRSELWQLHRKGTTAHEPNNWYLIVYFFYLQVRLCT